MMVYIVSRHCSMVLKSFSDLVKTQLDPVLHVSVIVQHSDNILSLDGRLLHSVQRQ